MRRVTFDAKIPDVVGGVLLAIVGAGFTFGGYGYGLRTSEGLLGPGAMPFLAGSLLIVFGGAGALTALRPRLSRAAPVATGAVLHEPTAPGEGDDATAGAPAEAAGTTGDSIVRVFSLLALAATAVIAITWFDTYITLGVLVLAILTVFERVPLWKSLAVAAGVMGVCYLIFSVLLNVPLPSVF